jgi:rhodanese-related sulfurtransferase
MIIAEISPHELHHRLQHDADVVVVDLRHPQEYQAGHIPGALSLFIEEIPRRLHELPQETDIVFQCWHGHTSLDVAAYAIEHGWHASRVASLSGGMAGWVQTHGVGALER